jgi:sulfonate transport system substrate-binding protein
MMHDRQRRQALKLLGAAAAASLLPRFAHAAITPPSVIRIAGGASFVEGKLHLTGLSSVINDQGWLAQELGKRNIRLEWFTTSHAAVGPMVNEGFANNTVDFASYGDLPSAILNAGGIETRLLVPNGYGQGDCFLVVPADSKARSIEDLKGKRLAIHRGRPWELPLVRLLQSKNLKYSDFKLFNINPQVGMAALAAGQVDALFTITDAYLLEERGLGKIIWSTKEAPPDWKMRTEFWGAKSFIQNYPELTQLVIDAYIKAAYWASQDANRDAMIKIAASAGTPESVIRRSYDDWNYSWKDRWSPLFFDVLQKHYRNALDFALDEKLITRKPDLSTWFDPRFAQASLKNLNLENYWQPLAAGSKSGKKA